MIKPPHISRQRPTKIIATLGPSSSSKEIIRNLFLHGADVFRLNFSHGTADDHKLRMKFIREIESEFGRPIAVLADLQGPKLRLGTFINGSIQLTPGQNFRLDLSPEPGNEERAPLLHPEIFAAIKPECDLLLDDGKVRLTVRKCGSDFADTIVTAGQKLSDRKGVNVPYVVLPISPLTTKDRTDMETALNIGADWVALSFVQRPEDVAEAKAIIGNRAAIMAKLEKPSAIQSLLPIVELADGLMVARGDLGVEMPPEDVPRWQKKILREARRMGKPVVVATQMLESMITNVTPTRAEASDVATAVYDGADAIMLSAETASGDYPVESVQMMDRIARHTIEDETYQTMINAQHPSPQPTAADALMAAARQVSETIHAAAIATYTTSGITTLRAARERPTAPIIGITSKFETARRLALSFGVHAVLTTDVDSYEEMIAKAVKIAHDEGLAVSGRKIVITAGFPFGKAGNTNVLQIAVVGNNGSWQKLPPP